MDICVFLVANNKMVYHWNTISGYLLKLNAVIFDGGDVLDDKKKKDNKDNDKLDIKKNVFQVMKENQKKQQEEAEKQQLEMQKKAEEIEKKKREEYEQKLMEERRELIRLKQGIIDESETIHEEKEEEIKLTFWGKIKNFFFQNKWWLGIGSVAAIAAVFLIFDFVNRPRPDMVILVIGEYPKIGEESDIQGYFESLAEDFNDNGKTEVSIYYIPYKADDDYANYQNGAATKLSTQLQIDDAVMIIAGDTFKDLISDEDILVDLSEIFPEDENVKKEFYYLKDTDFYQKIGVQQNDVTSDLYIALRKPNGVMYSNARDMAKTYDKDFPVFEKFIEDIQKK